MFSAIVGRANVTDGGPAKNNFQFSYGYLDPVAVDSSGNIYLLNLNWIAKIWNSTGILQNLCGNRSFGFSADGSNCSSPTTSLGMLRGSAVDNSGNFYFYENSLNFKESRIRKVSTAGNLTTIAGKIDSSNFDKMYMHVCRKWNCW
jgi:hypothetical protein